MSEAEFFVGPPPADKPVAKPSPDASPDGNPPQKLITDAAEIAASAAFLPRPVSERRDDPGAILQGLLGRLPGVTPDMAAEMRQAALNAGHNAVVEGRKIQKRAEKNLRRKKLEQRGKRGHG